MTEGWDTLISVLCVTLTMLYSPFLKYTWTWVWLSHNVTTHILREKKLAKLTRLHFASNRLYYIDYVEIWWIGRFFIADLSSPIWSSLTLLSPCIMHHTCMHPGGQKIHAPYMHYCIRDTCIVDKDIMDTSNAWRIHASSNPASWIHASMDICMSHSVKDQEEQVRRVAS